MRIAITGGTGMIGSKLTAFLLAHGHRVSAITRKPSYHKAHMSVIAWDPSLNYIESSALEGIDVVIHLAGANVGEYWSDSYKQEILESRVVSTKILCNCLARLKHKPKLLISASAIGYYGNQAPEKVLDEKNLWGDGFLADVCHQWERETDTAAEADIRVIRMRLGVVLSKTGGALNKMLRPFRRGFGGV